MRKTQSFYPPSPANVPEDLTAISTDYVLRAILLLVCVVFFFVLYFGTLVFAVLLIYWGIMLAGRDSAGVGFIILKILMIGFGVILALFLLKGLFFKKQRSSRSLHVEIKPEEQPRLFRFLKKLCDEVDAPFPRRVFLSFEVNASAATDVSLWSIFRPGGKDLYLGLGLVNVLNLTELKAVLAHEFGHFSQKSVRLSGYAYLAQGLTARMLFGCDSIDELLARWRAQEGVGWLAWIITSILWVLGKVFQGLFLGIFLVEKAMSRQMEFQADRVAVRVAGSDAIVHSLKRAMLGDATMQQTLAELAWAAERGLYTDNLFLQQTHAANLLRRRAKDKKVWELPLPTQSGQDQEVFCPKDEENYPAMWLDHPPNWQREDNAKEIYIRTIFDERSAWILFTNVEELKTLVTYRMYRVFFRARKGLELTDAEEVQAAINAEHDEVTHDPRYHGMYDDRAIKPGNLKELIAEVTQKPWTQEQLSVAYDSLEDEQVRSLAEQYRRRRDEFLFLRDVVNDQVKLPEEEFKFRGRYYDQEQAERLLRRVDKELVKDHEALFELDRKAFLIHFQMARHLGSAWESELLRRYHFHIEAQKFWENLQEQRVPVGMVLEFLSNVKSGEELEDTFLEIRDILKTAHLVLKKCLKKAEDLTIPNLKNMPAGQSLRPFLLKKNLVDGLTEFDDYITSKWITKFLNQFEEVQGRLNYIHFKSLGSLLKFQETLAQRCLTQWGVLAEVLDEEIVEPKRPTEQIYQAEILPNE